VVILNEATAKTMPDIQSGSTEPFIFDRDSKGEWHSDQAEKAKRYGGDTGHG